MSILLDGRKIANYFLWKVWMLIKCCKLMKKSGSSFGIYYTVKDAAKYETVNIDQES